MPVLNVTRRKASVVVTRKLPDVVETRMMELFEARLNTDDHSFSGDEPDRRPAGCRRAGADGHRRRDGGGCWRRAGDGRAWSPTSASA